MQKLTFATWFPGYNEVHAGKDVGIIPRLLKERYNVDSCVISDSLPRLFLRFMDGQRFDVFQVYHYTYRSLFAGMIYRMFNPHGKLYLKLDTDQADHDNKFSLSRVLFKVSRYDLVSGEHEYIKTFKGLPVLYLPNIVETPRIRGVKENAIIHVGRLGISEKDSVAALVAFHKVKTRFPGWVLVLIGSRTPELERYLGANPEMLESVILFNQVPHEQVYGIMARSKIILSTNRSESFGYAVVEAMQQGCVLVSTNLPAYREHTDNGRYGFLCVDMLGEAMQSDLTAMALGGEEYVRKRYSSDNIEKLWGAIR